MKLKYALWATAAWTVIGVVICVVLLATILKPPITRESEKRAGMAGSGAGVAMAIGYGVIWLPYAAAVGKKRREVREQEKAERATAKRKRKATG